MPEHTATDIHDQDVLSWADKFGVTPDDVRGAIKAVGTRVTDVQEYLHSHHASPGEV